MAITIGISTRVDGILRTRVVNNTSFGVLMSRFFKFSKAEIFGPRGHVDVAQSIDLLPAAVLHVFWQNGTDTSPKSDDDVRTVSCSCRCCPIIMAKVKVKVKAEGALRKIHHEKNTKFGHWHDMYTSQWYKFWTSSGSGVKSSALYVSSATASTTNMPCSVIANWITWFTMEPWR